MKDIAELFWRSSVTEIKQGYVYDEKAGEFVCLICGQSFTKGVVYPDEGSYFEAEMFTRIHINKEHSSVFEYLLDMDKKYTGLTDHRKNLLAYFYQGLSDQEIAKELGGITASTVRNHRFTLREQEKQAKVFLAIMELLDTEDRQENRFINMPRSVKAVDERFAITEDENRRILEKYFSQGLDGPLSKFPLKQKRKVAVLKHIMKRFQLNHRYSEKEVNRILSEVYPDYVTVRRYLIDYGFMDRENDGSAYWVKI